MIRFNPDTWTEALLRYFAMAAPDANVYVEIAAPDLRFAAMSLLAIALALWWRRRTDSARAACALLLLVLLATASWLLTSGNGRYFMPVLACVGPLVAGLIYLLPLTRWFRLFLAAGLLAAQVFVVSLSSPWGAWAWLPWAEAPYFQIDVPPVDPAAPPTTYVTLSSISYSLIAPQFPPSSRWLNITSIGVLPRDVEWGQAFLRDARGPLKVIAPTVPGQGDTAGRPLPEMRRALNALLSLQKLGVDESRPCQFLPSRGMASIQRKGQADPAQDHVGFWSCDLRYPVEPPPTQAAPIPARTEAVFSRIERDCPRFFQPGSARTLLINGGAVRQYGGADIKVYVMDDGSVLYKFWRALNAVLVGTVDAVLAGQAAAQCDRIRGRVGLPWEREI